MLRKLLSGFQYESRSKEERVEQMASTLKVLMVDSPEEPDDMPDEDDPETGQHSTDVIRSLKARAVTFDPFACVVREDRGVQRNSRFVGKRAGISQSRPANVGAYANNPSQTAGARKRDAGCRR